MLPLVLLFAGAVAATSGYPETCPVPMSQQRDDSTTVGICPADIDVFGPQLEAVFEGARAPTGIAVAPDSSIFFTYARNMEVQPWTLTKKVNFTVDAPWPSADWQNCATGQNVSECFVNVQNVVLDDNELFWVIDSGVPNGAAYPLTYGPKIMTFNYSTGELLRTYIYPEELFYTKLQLNDIKVNNTLGYAFITEDSYLGSITTLNLESGEFIRHIYNTTFTRPDEKFTSMYNGRPIRNWNGTTPSYLNSGTNGIALASGNVYWGVKASHRYYFADQTVFTTGLTDEEIMAKIQVPGTFPSESAGFTADDHGRVYMTASEHNAILYIDTLQSEQTDAINGVAAGGSGLIPTENYVHKTLIRGGNVQAADTTCILDGWFYFSTNQQGLAPLRQYNNIDKRRGPFRSYRFWIGRGPAAA